MTLKIYDSPARALRDFHPLTDGKVGIYLCGATVQGSPHIGHMRSAVAFDVLRRWLMRRGYEVTLIRNVTDIDDKILNKSSEAGCPWWAWAYTFEQEFNAAYDALGVIRPTYEPHATAHIPEQIALIERLIERGHAYATDAGNVYFDVSSQSDYGSLTNQRVGDLAIDESESEPDKRNPHDFALWKRAKESEPDSAKWETPWGAGRPGWHLECSAMSGKYLGESFDIHAGGIDLRFPHHENEQAQSHGAGYGFAQYWMHNAWVTIDGEKMSKSLGNSLTVANILKEHPAVLVRFALGTVHYRSTVAYSDKTLREAGAVWDRLKGFVERAANAVGEIPADELMLRPKDLPEEFVGAMDDDVNVSAALAIIHEHVKRGNSALSEGREERVRMEQLLVRSMLDVLGLDPLSPQWRGGSSEGSAAMKALDALVKDVLDKRAQARADKDWATADAMRDLLTGAGISVADSAEGATWKLGD
ncbi:cysteine--tRNA ligase [Arcanobacterium canis]